MVIEMLAYRPDHRLISDEVYNHQAVEAEVMRGRANQPDEIARQRRRAAVAEIVEAAHKMPSSSEVQPVKLHELMTHVAAQELQDELVPAE